MRTSFSFVQRVRPDRASKIDENVRPMAVTERCEVKGRVCNDSRVSEHAISSGSGQSSHDPFLCRYLPLLPRRCSPLWRALTLTLKTCDVQKGKQRVRLSLDGDRYGATHPLERKEKKKKDQVADVSDHAQLQIVKGARKKKKTEDPETPVEAEPVSSNPEGKGVKRRKHDREDEEPPSGDKKKKKRKREKNSGAAYDLAADPPLDVPDAPGAAGTVAVVPEITEVKERKENKSPADGTGNSRKRKPTKADGVKANGQEGSKSKKRNKGDVVEDEEHPSTPVPADDHSSRKRKQPKAESVHLDPSDDPDLTEQSQKGSHPSHFLRIPKFQRFIRL